MDVQWDIVLPPLSVIVTVFVMWWRLDNKIEDVRKASETAHQSIHDNLCDIKVILATIKTDVDWLKRNRQADPD